MPMMLESPNPIPSSPNNGERGQATIMMAVFMGIVMMGFLGFALDVGYFFQQKRQAQAAADAAAIAAAEEKSVGNTANVQGAANAIATINGFNTSAATNPASVTLAYPSSGNYSTQSAAQPNSWVQATVSRNVPTFFLAAFNRTSSMNVTATAVAGEGETSPTCICLEGGTGMDLNMSNNSKLTASGCGVTVNSSSSNAVGVVGSANLAPLSLGMISSSWVESSQVNNGGSINSSTDIVEGISSGCNPTMPAAPSDSTCSADPFSSIQNGGSTYTVGPGSSYGTTVNGNTICYNALTIGANGDTVTLNPGIYVINGGSLHFESGTQRGGNGVFFYLENNASLTIDNGANPNLIAPSSGTYQNVLFYQPSSNTSALNFQGGSTTTITGVIYAPGANITIGNGSSSSLTLGIVAQSLTLNGGCNLISTSQAYLGTLNISSGTLRQ
jgi:Flp pilus assembly protein TadG